MRTVDGQLTEYEGGGGEGVLRMVVDEAKLQTGDKAHVGVLYDGKALDKSNDGYQGPCLFVRHSGHSRR